MTGERFNEAMLKDCPLCGDSGRFSFRARDLFYRTGDYEAELYRCRSCRALYQWPLPDRETLAGFYPGGYWLEAEAPTTFSRLKQKYVAQILEWDLLAWVKRLKLPARARFLDIGCGRGDWLARVAIMGYVVGGIESDSRAVAYARSRFGLEIDQIDVDDWHPAPEQFDCISMFHVLEHVPRPAQLLARCRVGLKPGGLLLMRVPNEGSWQSRVLGKAWKGLEIPRHLVHFNPTALVGLLDRAGFEVVTRSTWSLRDGPTALASTLFPSGEPTRQQVLGENRPIRTWIYLALTWFLTPFEALAAVLGQGAMITVIARKARAATIENRE